MQQPGAQRYQFILMFLVSPGESGSLASNPFSEPYNAIQGLTIRRTLCT